MTPAQAIEARLEETRRQLLDLSRRNRLLNHKKTSRSALALVDELPDQVFQILVGKGKTMQFKSLEEAPQDSPVHALAAEQPELEQQEGEQGPDLPLAPIDTRQTPTRQRPAPRPRRQHTANDVSLGFVESLRWLRLAGVRRPGPDARR